MQRVLSFSGQTSKPDHFADALPNYVESQHHQCVQCSLPFPAEPWMSGDVRSDVKVQVFSNRLKGGPGEPKRNVCGICQMQFLAEKLNYREVRGEQSIYLHLFPYSFQTRPFVSGLSRQITRIRNSDVLSGALRLKDAEEAMLKAAKTRETKLNFTTRTKENKAQPYGLSLPRYAETLGGVMTFPVNAVGENDTERFLFAMQYALLLQRHFGCKVLMSGAVTPPLDKEAFGDVYFDMAPLSGRGLIRHNDYREPRNNGNSNKNARGDDTGNLRQLWKELEYLYTIQRAVLVRNSKPLLKLVTAMADQALSVFHAAERLAEEKAGSGGDAGWVMRTIADEVRALAKSRGGYEMHELDDHLQQLAEIAWKGGLRGKTLKKNSLMAPMDEVLRKIGALGQELNDEVLRAAAAQDLYEHLTRIHDIESKRLHDACVKFVEAFFDGVFGEVYHGKLSRLLNHEKVLRSAFHFYIRQQIPRKAVTTNGKAGDNGGADEEPDDETPFQEGEDTGDLF
ncbi:MAG: type I-D CRISPR-associated protein Cas10d/Csc3 [Chloroflexaceae bacterium]|nr:type I-D CRISPR-associated protein Cas10d/Csc3 [Chloroflexaceae bacterium]